MSLPPAKRLRQKVSPPPQAPLTELPDFATEEKSGSRKCVYLVTFPHPRQVQTSDGIKLVAPETFTKQELMGRFLRACNAPVHTDAQLRGHSGGTPSVTVNLACLFRELHQENAEAEVHKHDHIGVNAVSPFRFNPVKRALLLQSGLASHWSCTHEGNGVFRDSFQENINEALGVLLQSF